MLFSLILCSATQNSLVQNTVYQWAVYIANAFVSSAEYIAVQYSAVQYSAVQYNAVQYSAVQCSAVPCSAVHIYTTTAAAILGCRKSRSEKSRAAPQRHSDEWQEGIGPGLFPGTGPVMALHCTSWTDSVFKSYTEVKSTWDV